ncbi:Fungalysin/Thermolysin Extracellular metalloproteinase 5 [Emydomyces testavorans]|uniref:Neutral protease 2 n=1 Tax=Emydomyces testavorans TaxID=2070801 RepID=A0AAF0ILI5_9EURO|nr:Fungalysin/Thermolysin Extracellular metalloproteinase 5 [Emydomyces testavorans]
MFVHSIFIALVALTGKTLATPLNGLPERHTELNVQLTSIGNTRVKAVVTNNGQQEMSFLKYNTIFDSAPIRKVTITKDGSMVPFKGINRYYDINNLPKGAFTVLAPGASAEAEFDVAETSDLSAGGSYAISANGLIPIVDGQGTSLTGAVRYTANTLIIDVDGETASKVQSAIPEMSIDKRSRLDDYTCRGKFGSKGNYANILEAGLRTCVRYAQRAAQAAASGSTEKFSEWFKTTSEQARQSVARRFEAIAEECGSTGGKVKYFCWDQFNGCEEGIIAYTIPSKSYVINCEAYWRIPPVVNSGLDPDQGLAIVHEFTHVPSVYSPATEELAIGIARCKALNSEQSLKNADNYALYAASVSRGG